MAQDSREPSHVPEAESHWSNYLSRGRGDRRFQFRLSTLFLVVAACCLLLKLMQAFPAGSILATVIGGSIGVVRGWWRGTFWQAVAGVLVAFWTLHWHFLVPGFDWDAARWPLFSEPFECLLLAAAGSLLGSVFFSASAPEMAAARAPRHAIRLRRWLRLGSIALWLLVAAALGALAARLPVPWGVTHPGGETSLLISAVIYCACLSRNAIIFTTLFSHRNRHWMLAAPVAVALGVVYLLVLRAVLQSVYWQNSSAHHQDHMGTVLTVVASALLFEASLTLATVAAKLCRPTEPK